MKPEENAPAGVPMITVGTKDGLVTRPATPEEIARQQKSRQVAKARGLSEKVEAVSHITGAGEKKALSKARQRLQELRTADPGISITPMVTVEAAGEKFLVRRLNFAQLTRLGMLTPRDENGMLDVANPSSLTTLTSAMLFCAACDEKGNDFFESLQESYEWVIDLDPGIIAVITTLFNKILEINPDIIPGSDGKKPTAQQEETAEKKDESGENAAPENPTSS